MRATGVVSNRYIVIANFHASKANLANIKASAPGHGGKGQLFVAAATAAIAGVFHFEQHQSREDDGGVGGEVFPRWHDHCGW